MENEKENAVETIVEIEISEDGPTQPHNGKNINQIIVSQYIEHDPYAVTYSEKDNSIFLWLVNVEKNGQQQPDIYSKLDKFDSKIVPVLYKKTLVFIDDINHPRLIDLSDDKGRPLQLKHQKVDQMGFLPNRDLILLVNKKIYKYSFINKPTNDAALWEHSQIYDIEIHERLNKHFIKPLVYQTKLFLFNKGLMTQWDLSTMTFEMQYNLANVNKYFIIVINKYQTILALCQYDEYDDKKTDVYSMETGKHISRYDNHIPVEFVILKDGSEGLIIRTSTPNSDKKIFYKFLDPFHPSDAIDIPDDIITNDITDDKNFIITKSNKKLYIKENNLWVTDGLNEDTFQQMLNTTYHSNIYTLPIFKTIQNMLKDVQNEVYCDFPEDNRIELADGELFRFNLERVKLCSRSVPNVEILFRVKVKGLKKSQNNEWKETRNRITLIYDRNIFSYEQLNNWDLALVTHNGIYIYTIVEDFLRLRYYWYYNSGTQEHLDNEFNDLQFSLPSPTLEKCMNFKELALSIINDPVEFSKYGSKILEIAIERKYDNVVQFVFDEIIKLIEREDCDYMPLLPIISLNLPKLCDNYSSLVRNYVLLTSILLDPSCSSVENSTNSLYAYSKDIYIKKSVPLSNNYFKRLTTLYKKFIHLKSQEETPTIRFIVPFPQICKYQENDQNPWNEILYKPKSILFCNIDSNNFYKWWNFAAIIDFKWQTSGKYFYSVILFNYTIYYLCFALAATLDLDNYYHKALFTISNLFGLMQLFSELQLFIWDWKLYIKDLRNLLDIGVYSLPVITSMYWIFNNNSPLQIIAISVLLLNFKFLLFLQVFDVKYGGKNLVKIFGVAGEVFPFLLFLFLIIIGFSHAFFILLRSIKNSDLVTTYSSVNSDGTISSTPTLVQTPDSNTNLFNWFSTSLLAMYFFLSGNSGYLSLWTYRENPTMTILLVSFSFFTVIYLMNLFIGLLNLALQDYNADGEYLLIKAQAIMEIELFYTLRSQRRKKEWFPNWIYYDMPIDEVRKLINAIDDRKTKFNLPPFAPFISKKLRGLIEIQLPIGATELQRQIEQMNGELKQMNNELKQQMRDELKQTKNELMKDMQELLNSFVKNSIANENVKDKKA